jgi:DNA anti-recombination protein RmuC
MAVVSKGILSQMTTTAGDRGVSLWACDKLEMDQYWRRRNRRVFHAPEVMMTPEEMDRKIEFILQMQARFGENIEKMRVEFSAADERLRGSQATLTVAAIRITELMEQAQRQTDERFKRLDERLNALIS